MAPSGALRQPVQAAYLCDLTGKLLGSTTRRGATEVGPAEFIHGLLGIINKMETSFPTLGGKSLRTIRKGQLTILIERGSRTFAVLVVEFGTPPTEESSMVDLDSGSAFTPDDKAQSERLHREMRTRLKAFEAEDNVGLGSASAEQVVAGLLAYKDR
jgi:hypothetical protein